MVVSGTGFVVSPVRAGVGRRQPTFSPLAAAGMKPTVEMDLPKETSADGLHSNISMYRRTGSLEPS